MIPLAIRLAQNAAIFAKNLSYLKTLHLCISDIVVLASK